MDITSSSWTAINSHGTKHQGSTLMTDSVARIASGQHTCSANDGPCPGIFFWWNISDWSTFKTNRPGDILTRPFPLKCLRFNMQLWRCLRSWHMQALMQGANNSPNKPTKTRGLSWRNFEPICLQMVGVSFSGIKHYIDTVVSRGVFCPLNILFYLKNGLEAHIDHLVRLYDYFICICGV